MRVIPLHSEVTIHPDNAADLDALLKRIAYPAGCEGPSAALVIEVATYAEERLVAAGIRPENREGCTLLFKDHAPEHGSEEPTTVPFVGIERMGEGWAVYQAGRTRVRPGDAGSFGFGFPFAASEDMRASE